MQNVTSVSGDLEDIRVFIVARNAFARVGLRALLESQTNVVAIGDSAPDATLPRQVELVQPHALLWDLEWEADLEQLALLSAEIPPVLALLSDSAFVSAAWASGALGLLPRDAAPSRIAAALVAVAQRLTVFEPSLVAALLPERLRPPEEALTNREREVLILLSEGLTNKSIALRLGISENTVKFHVNAIMSKLGAQSRTEAVVRAARLGLIAL
ncbi:MAG: response regulator transcription factor [Chloroflexi bacterium]|jgi:DNA-binding NarL/FixJ family response regulator|nr:response regulator transcription factor [Chloroflexota bacterium]